MKIHSKIAILYCELDLKFRENRVIFAKKEGYRLGIFMKIHYKIRILYYELDLKFRENRVIFAKK